MASAQDSGSTGPAGSSAGLGHRVVFLDKKLCSHSTSFRSPRSKWVPAICQGNLKKCWGLAFHPGGSSNTASRLMHHLAPMSHQAPPIHCVEKDFNHNIKSNFCNKFGVPFDWLFSIINYRIDTHVQRSKTVGKVLKNYFSQSDNNTSDNFSFKLEFSLMRKPRTSYRSN